MTKVPQTLNEIYNSIQRNTNDHAILNISLASGILPSLYGLRISFLRLTSSQPRERVERTIYYNANEFFHTILFAGHRDLFV